MSPAQAMTALDEARRAHRKLTKDLERTTRRVLENDPTLPAHAGNSIPGMERSIERLEGEIAALEPVAQRYRYEASIAAHAHASFPAQQWYPEGTMPAPFDCGDIPEFLRRTKQ